MFSKNPEKLNSDHIQQFLVRMFTEVFQMTNVTAYYDSHNRDSRNIMILQQLGPTSRIQAIKGRQLLPKYYNSKIAWTTWQLRVIVDVVFKLWYISGKGPFLVQNVVDIPRFHQALGLREGMLIDDRCFFPINIWSLDSTCSATAFWCSLILCERFLTVWPMYDLLQSAQGIW